MGCDGCVNKTSQTHRRGPPVCARRKQSVKRIRVHSSLIRRVITSEQAGNVSPFERSTRLFSPRLSESGFRSQPRTRLSQTRSPFERETSLVGRKNGGAHQRKKKRGSGNAKSHLKPPRSAGSFEEAGGSQILFADAYIYLSPQRLSLYIGIYRCVRGRLPFSPCKPVTIIA